MVGFPAQTRSFLFSKISRKVLGPTQPPFSQYCRLLP